MEYSDMDDASLVQLALQDDEQAKNELIDRCKDVISYHVVKYKAMYHGRLSGFDVEDLISECYLVTLQCIKTYDPSRKVQFSTYAMRMIRNRILDFLKRRKMKHDKHENREFDLTRLVATERISLSDRIITKSSERDKQIVALFLDGNTQTEIGEIFGLHKTRIMQIIKKTVG